MQTNFNKSEQFFDINGHYYDENDKLERCENGYRPKSLKKIFNIFKPQKENDVIL